MKLNSGLQNNKIIPSNDLYLEIKNGLYLNLFVILYALNAASTRVKHPST